MPDSMERTRPKLGKKDFIILSTGLGTCILAAVGVMGFTPIAPGY